MIVLFILTSIAQPYENLHIIISHLPNESVSHFIELQVVGSIPYLTSLNICENLVFPQRLSPQLNKARLPFCSNLHFVWAD